MLWFIAVCVTLLVFKLHSDWKKRIIKNYPPGPRGIPLLGNLLEVSRLVKETGFDWGAWRQLSKSYGPVLRLKLGLAQPLLVVSGRPAILEFLAKRDFDGRPDTIETRQRCLGKKRGIIFNEGHDWAEQKRFLLRILKDFGLHKQSMEDLVLEDAKMLCNIVNDKMLNKETNVHDLCDITAIAVVSSLWNLIASTRYDPKEENSEMLQILSILKQSFRNGRPKGALWTHIPFLRFIMPKFSGFTDDKERVETITKYFLKEVTKHKETRVPGEPRDLIDKYLEEIESCNNNETSSFDELQLVILLRDIFSAGVETTSNSIGFVVSYLAKYSDIQSKIQEELDKVIGNDGNPRLIYKNSLPYLNATIAEVSRLANVAPTTIAHRALTNCSILGYDVEKNWSVIGNLRSVHMDPDHWVDSEAFRPERFIDSNGLFVEDPWLMPFGLGRRKCLGENLARTSLFLFLASLLRSFRFELAPGETAPCLLGVNSFTISPPPISIVMRLRRGLRDTHSSP